MQLSENFTLKEFTKSWQAERLGIDNRPSQKEIFAMGRLCQSVLQPVRNHFGVPVIITSGFRCLKLNKAIGSDDNSQHITGEAADFKVKDVPALTVAEFIEQNLDFDQLILEWRNKQELNHVSYRKPKEEKTHISYVLCSLNRNEVLYSPRPKVFLKGLPEFWPLKKEI
jgi:hypothetical protein